MEEQCLFIKKRINSSPAMADEQLEHSIIKKAQKAIYLSVKVVVRQGAVGYFYLLKEKEYGKS
jgi:hypothetical protein